MKTKVILVAVIHRLHREVPFYTLGHLRSLLEALDPEVVCAEIPPFRYLTEDHLESRPELQEVILPYVRSTGCRLWSLEPDGPVRYELSGGPHLTASVDEGIGSRRSDAGSQRPELLKEVSSTWDSAGDIYGPRTGRLIRERLHEREVQAREVETMAWVDWNIYAFCRILEAVQTYPYRRIAAAVSAAHLHWLERYLAKVSGIQLFTADQVIDTDNLLKADQLSFPQIPVNAQEAGEAPGLPRETDYSVKWSMINNASGRTT